jgi:hypothetical protein|tara:strand:- start:2464 stop:2754 length:291 start_codon:yes stop_codon:yes gene_type:complete
MAAYWLAHQLTVEFMENEKEVNDTHNWRSEYIDLAGHRLKPRQIELLEKGPDSLSASWVLMAMFSDWKHIKGYKDPEPPDCQSSFKEWNSNYESSD